MKVEAATFMAWVEQHFPEYRVKGDEVKLHSVFCDDRKFHLQCNPDKNCFHCFKSGAKGSLVKLVAYVQGCSPKEAADILGIGNPLRTWDSRLEDFFSPKVAEEKPPPPDQISFPPNTFRITDLSEMSRHRKWATAYLTGRKIPPSGFFVCTAGKYRDRIIIPYRGPNGNLIYWNGRDLTDQSPARYRGPDRDEYKVGKEDVMYFYEYPEAGETVYVTEGEFDSVSLVLAGLSSCALGGKELFDRQLEMIAPYRLCLAFDSDERGQEALHNVGNRLVRSGLAGVSYVRPPAQFKDWNDMFKQGGPVASYLNRAQKPFDPWSSLTSSLGV